MLATKLVKDAGLSDESVLKSWIKKKDEARSFKNHFMYVFMKVLRSKLVTGEGESWRAACRHFRYMYMYMYGTCMYM